MRSGAIVARSGPPANMTGSLAAGVASVPTAERFDLLEVDARFNPAGIAPRALDNRTAVIWVGHVELPLDAPIGHSVHTAWHLPRRTHLTVRPLNDEDGCNDSPFVHIISI